MAEKADMPLDGLLKGLQDGYKGSEDGYNRRFYEARGTVSTSLQTVLYDKAYDIGHTAGRFGGDVKVAADAGPNAAAKIDRATEMPGVGKLATTVLNALSGNTAKVTGGEHVERGCAVDPTQHRDTSAKATEAQKR